jgi:hypothetical protein
MAAILLKNHSADESSKLVSNLLTLPKDMTCGSACSGTGASPAQFVFVTARLAFIHNLNYFFRFIFIAWIWI